MARGRPNTKKEVAHQLLLRLLNHRRRWRASKSPDRYLQGIDASRLTAVAGHDAEGDLQGWVLVQDLQGKDSPIKMPAGKTSSERQSYFDRKGYLFFREIGRFIESKNKRSGDGYLEYYSAARNGRLRKNYGSAYRVKRDEKTWKALFLYFHDRNELHDFQTSDYYAFMLNGAGKKVYEEFYDLLPFPGSEKLLRRGPGFSKSVIAAAIAGSYRQLFYAFLRAPKDLPRMVWLGHHVFMEMYSAENHPDPRLTIETGSFEFVYFSARIMADLDMAIGWTLAKGKDVKGKEGEAFLESINETYQHRITQFRQAEKDAARMAKNGRPAGISPVRPNAQARI